MTTTPTARPTVEAATQKFVEVFSDGDTVHTLATEMTCIEVDAFAAFLRAVGADEAAAEWIFAHSEGDDEGDRHYPGGAAA